MEKLSSLNPEVTFYIRTAKKLGFIQKSKKSVLNQRELKEMAQKKTNIPTQKQILYYNGQEVKQNKTIKIVDKSIVHVIDSRNVGQPRMKLSVKRLTHTSESQDFEVDSNTSIDEFIKSELEPFYEQPAEKLFFVYSGRQLKRQKSFSEEYVQSETQLVCVHSEKDRKNKSKKFINPSSANSLKSKDTIQTKTGITPKKQQAFLEDTQPTHIQKVQNSTVNKNSNSQQVETINQGKIPQRLQPEKKKEESYIDQSIQNQIQPSKNQKKVIKSIEEIQCGQIESDEDSDNDADIKLTNNYPQKLPEEYLMEQTRSRSKTKSDHQNNSGSSSISEANFKKKKKVTQVDFLKGSQLKGQEQMSPKSLNQSKSPSEKTSKQNQIQNQKASVQNVQKTKQKTNNYKTRDEIFENNNNTYSSVIDEPQESCKGMSLQSGNLDIKNQREEAFSSYINRQQNQVYDSQMNYHQGDNVRMEVRGFMNFSNASFLQSSQLQTPQSPSYQHHLLSFGQINGPSGIRENEGGSQVNSMAPQLLTYQVNPRKQFSQQMGGDSLSFSKEQSEVKFPEESQDNLFVQYRRGLIQQQRNNNIMIREDEITQSNLLSETYNNQTTTEMMNSITFNLEPNPDGLITYSRQSAVQIVDQDEIQEQNHIEYQKRDSQIQTNVRDSANPSQIYSNDSSQINQKPLEENLSIEPMSLIDGLASMADYQIQVNSIESQDSLDESVNHPKKNFVHPQSDISYDPSNNQSIHSNSTQTIANINASKNTPSNILLQSNSDVFVQFQAYTANFQPSVNEQNQQNNQILPKQIESNMLDQNSFGVIHEKSLQNGFLKNTLMGESQIQTEQILKNQNQAIKIVEEDSVQQQNEFYRPGDSGQIDDYLQNSIKNEEIEHSAAFHEISQSLHVQIIQESSNFINKFDNNEQYDITFRKDHKSDQNRTEVYQGQSRMEQPQGSRLLYELSIQAMNQSEQPQLLPGDYIYSTDKVQSPEEALNSILDKFAHCF